MLLVEDSTPDEISKTIETRGQGCRSGLGFRPSALPLICVDSALISRTSTEQITMDVGLWSELPIQLLERVLPFLPVPDLCRFRNVCQRWNSLICTSEFGKLCVQNASRGGASAGACLVSKFRVYSSMNCLQTEIPSWSVLDLITKRWYNIANSLLKGFEYRVATMDGGLVCTFVSSFTSEQRCKSTYLCDPKFNMSAVTLVISNLIGGRIKVLPNPLLGIMDLTRMDLKLAVENITNTYRVFLFYRGFCWDSKYPCHSVCVYESSTNQWRSAPNPPGSEGAYGPYVRSVVFEGHFYVLFRSLGGFINRLYKFDPLEDAWEDTGVHFRQRAIELCDMVVSDNRLFLVTQYVVNDMLERAYGKLKTMPCPLDISEILLADKVCRTVVQMTEAELRRNLSIDSTIDCGAGVEQFQLSAFGLDKSVLLMCEETGKVMRYNLETEAWELFPPNPAELPHLESISHGLLGSISRFGKQMSYLRLPSAPW